MANKLVQWGEFRVTQEEAQALEQLVDQNSSLSGRLLAYGISTEGGHVTGLSWPEDSFILANPAAMSGLAWLKELSIPGAEVTSLEFAAGLLDLGLLNINNNPILSLGPLKETRALRRLFGVGIPAKDLHSLEQLGNLERLNLSHTAISSIAPLEKLPLKQLFLWKCERIHDFSPLSQVQSLVELDVSETGFGDGDLEPLKGLAHLKVLNINRTNCTKPAMMVFRYNRPDVLLK